MIGARPLKIAVIAGEESGDLLGADLIAAMHLQGRIEVSGVGGRHLAAQGQVSLFDPHEIALIGVSSIIKKLPRLIGLIAKTAAYIVKEQPDCLVIIDSPEFCHRVAKKVRRANPNIPIVNYICPSVWAWRPARAQAMRQYIDHVLAILPFEPEFLIDHGGPPATYVGHPAARNQNFIDASSSQMTLETARRAGGKKQLLLLPGSRRSEVRRTIGHINEIVHCLQARGHSLQLLLPTISHVEADVRQYTRHWSIQPDITTDASRKLEMFGSADAALAASGTVTLELALCKVPTVAIYDLDTLARLWVRLLFTGWTASLPNLIADEPIVPEYYNDHIRAGRVARELERLLAPSQTRDAQLAGFAKLRDTMATARTPADLAVEVILSLIAKSRSRR